jgi:hypothetical protein
MVITRRDCISGLIGMSTAHVLQTNAAKAEPDAAVRALTRFDAPWSDAHRVCPATRMHLVRSDGQYLFPLFKTAWAYFAASDPDGIVRKAQDEGFNGIRVCLEGTPYLDVLGYDLWPWGGTRDAPEFTRFDDRYWDEVRRRFEIAGRAGIGINLCLYFTLKSNDIASQRPYWQQALDRLGGYANLFCWEIHNEHIDNAALQDAAGEFFHTRDPLARPVITSTGTTDDAIWPGKPWMHLAINHSCTSSDPARHPLGRWYQSAARNTRSHGKPAFCNESGRERRHRNNDGVHRRKQGWTWCASGCYWNYHSWDGCEGINDLTYHAPGVEFMKPLGQFFSSRPYWQLAPNHTALRILSPASDPPLVASVLAAPNRSRLLAYVCTEESGKQVDDLTLLLRLHRGTFTVTTFDPVTLAERSRAEIECEMIIREVKVPVATFIDDVVIEITGRAARDHEFLPDTR